MQRAAAGPQRAWRAAPDQSQRRKRARLLDRAVRDHGVETRVAAAVQLGALRLHNERKGLRERQDRRLLLGLPLGERTARRLQHFERADDALRIGGAEARGGQRIKARELGVQRLRRRGSREKPVAGADSPPGCPGCRTAPPSAP